MKCGIVNKSLLDKHNRWDAGFFLGGAKEDVSREDVEKRRKDVETAQKRLDNAIKKQQESTDRVDGFVASGEVQPMEDEPMD